MRSSIQATMNIIDVNVRQVRTNVAGMGKLRVLDLLRRLRVYSAGALGTVWYQPGTSFEESPGYQRTDRRAAKHLAAAAHGPTCPWQPDRLPAFAFSR